MRVRIWLTAIACLIALVCSAVVLSASEREWAMIGAAVVFGALLSWAIRSMLSSSIERARAAIGARTHAQRSSHDAPDLPRLVLDQIPGMVSTLLPDGRAELLNRRALEFFGRDAMQMQVWSELVHPEDQERFHERWRHAFATACPLEIEIRARRADGVYRWMDSRIHPLRDDRGRIVRWCNLLIDIDDRKRAVEAVRASEQGLRLILDSIPGFVHTLTPDGEIELVNRRIVEFFGLPPEELRDWSSVTHPDDIARVGAILVHSLRTGSLFECESRARRADGVYRWFHARGMPLRDENGRIVRWYHVLTDIDDRKRAEEALRASEQNLRLMVDSIPGFICTNTSLGEVEYVNKTLLDYTGKPLSELRNWPIVVHPEDLPTVAAHWQHSIATGVPFNVEVRVRRADDTYRWFQCRGLPLRADDGAILRWYNLLTDIEDRKIAEEKLRARERDLALIIETIPAHVWCAAPDGTLTYCNRRILQYSGITFDNLVLAPYQYIHPEDRDAVVQVWTQALRSGSLYENQYRMRRADGEFRWIQAIGQLGRDETGQPIGWYGVLIDVDDRVRMEEMLRDTRARLARATQIATVGELSASIAHEINQPLAAVVANGHACHKWLTAAQPNIPRALVCLERIIRDGRAAADVIQRIRALYRHAPLSKDALSINDVIEEVCRLVENDVRRRSILMRIELEQSLPAVLADRVQLQQVLANLVRNAMEAMDPVMDRSRELAIVSQREDGRVVVHVRDTGIGMENFAHAFDTFFTTKPNGMGMGLAICRSIVEAHGGRLWATCATPCGSIFSFSLPAAEDTDVQAHGNADRADRRDPPTVISVSV